MAIQYFPHPLGEGIKAVGSSLGAALQQRGERAFQREQKETEFQRKRDLEEQQRQRQVQQQGALSQALQAAKGVEGGPMDQFSAFQQAMSESGIPIDPKTSLDYMKSLGDIYTKEQKAAVRDPIERQTYKQNQTFMAGINSDARTASSLYREMGTLTDAIESPDISRAG